MRLSLLALLGSLGLGSRGLIGSFLLLLLALGFESGLLLLDDFLVLLDGFGVKFDGGVAGAAVVAIPMLSHEDTGAAARAVLLEVGDVAVV